MKIDGFLIINKPVGVSSNHVVQKVKRILKADKVGHLGTLDPFASGVLPLLLGGAARMADEVISNKKTYLFKISLGDETDTLDCEGKITRSASVPANFVELFNEVRSRFLGAIVQIPPEYSALKVNGVPLYELKRRGIELPIDMASKHRQVFIDSLDLVDYSVAENWLMLRTSCSKGTYVRSLARDIAVALGTVGHCSELVREAVEPWALSAAVSPDHPQLIECVQSVFLLTPNIPCLDIELNNLSHLQNGNRFQIVEGQNSQRMHELCQNGAASSVKAFVRHGDSIVYLAELSLLGAGVVVQPRKRIV